MSGSRYGEAAGLRCGDIDLRRGVIHIERDVVEVTRDDGVASAGRRREGNLVYGPPKSGRARDVPLPLHLARALPGLIDGQYRPDLVFRSERGAHVHVERDILGHHDLRVTSLYARSVP